MTQNKSKRLNKELSNLGKAIRELDGVTNHSERVPETPKETKAKSAIGSFTFNETIINYIIIESDGTSFINFRMNIEYPKNELLDSFSDRSKIMEKLNDKNNKTIGLKYFIAHEDEEIVTISANSEYVINEEIKSYGFIRFPIAILSTGLQLLDITKKEE